MLGKTEARHGEHSSPVGVGGVVTCQQAVPPLRVDGEMVENYKVNDGGKRESESESESESEREGGEERKKEKKEKPNA